jgi:methyltransferase
VVGLIAWLAVLAMQRAHELGLSARHERVLRSRGAVEYGRSHFPWMVLLHAAFPLALIAEVLWQGERPPRLWPWCLVVLALATALRAWSMAALGERWTTRVLVVPGTAPLRRGPYRWFRHPSYLAAALELAAAPLLFGAWRTALAFSALNLPLMVARARVEARALEASSAPAFRSP